MPWDGGRLWITFNGEIYNFLELRGELEAAGYRFRSRTDTEVILASYDRWGLAAIERFAGMFAFALWDAARHRLWIARDRLGKKPLDYASYGGTLRFASELKAIVRDDRFPSDVDRAALRLYLRYGCVPAPWTIYAAAKKLPPAHYLTWQDGRTEIVRYWDPVPFAHEEPLGDEAAIAGLESRLSLAVEQRRIADVPLGAFLSGGIDSSLIVALMQEQSTTPVQTFTIRFEQAEYDEADHAAAVAGHLGTDHYEETCGERQLLDVVDALPAMFDEPFADSSAVPTFLVSRIARSRVTVALSGDGGDELFLGYPRHRFLHASRWALALPGPVRRSAASVAGHLPTRRLRRIADVLRSDEDDSYSRFITWFAENEICRFDRGASRRQPVLRGGSLPRGGVGSGAAWSTRLSLVPARRHPHESGSSVHGGQPRGARPSARSSCGGVCPGAACEHEAAGRDVEVAPPRAGVQEGAPPTRGPSEDGIWCPLAEWFRGPLRQQMAAYCGGSDFGDLGLDPAPIRQMWHGFLAGRPCRPDLLWQVYMLAAWARASHAQPAVMTASERR